MLYSSIYQYLIAIGLSIFMGMGTFILKSFNDRLKIVEDKMNSAVTEQNVRTILSDKIDPVKEDISEIKQAIVKIYELYLSEKK